MVGGWVFGLSPSFLHEELNIHISRPIIGGLFAALVAFTTGASQLVLRRRHGHRPTTLALAAVVAGMGLMAASSIAGSLTVLVIGGLVSGVGAGVAQMNAMAAVQHIAPVHARGSVMSTYATLCYLAISVPVIIAGQAADRFGLAAVTAWYFVAVTLVVAVALVLLRRANAGSARMIDVSRVAGTTLTVRPVEATDLEDLGRMFRKLSRESVYLRFFSPLPNVDLPMLTRMTDVDHDRRDGLVALDGAEIVAIANYAARDESGSGEAEIAVVVDDAWQRRGVGLRLTRRLVALALGRDYDTVVARVLPVNRAALALMRALSPQVAARFTDGEYEVRFTNADIAGEADVEPVSAGEAEQQLVAGVVVEPVEQLVPVVVAVAGGRHESHRETGDRRVESRRAERGDDVVDVVQVG